MSVAKYRSKRNFKVSPEPTGGKADTDKLRFVIQKHDASHLHYDFRLEMGGVLKSWAIPKGPSTDPSIKRLAVMVEDHPYDYRNFEGIIPNGYGAGTVMVWDEGYYEPSDQKLTNKSSKEKLLRHQLHAGKLTITLHGKKLKGEYALIKASSRSENSWLLFKIKDSHHSTNDILLNDKSVVSKKTMGQIEKPPLKKKPNPSDKKLKLPPGAKKARFPVSLKPMLAVLTNKPFDEEGWLYEVKWDGYRALAFMKKTKVDLKSRNDKSFNDKFYPVTKALKDLRMNAVLDGEIVVVDKNGISSFGALQNWRSEADGELYYYVFDILWLNNKDLTQIPLLQRRKVLEKLIPEKSIIKLSKSFDHSGIEFFESAKKIGLEGVMAKKANSLYKPGERSDEWLKIKVTKRQEMVIGGFTKNDKSSKYFSSLLVGVFEKAVFTYMGKIGTGFSDKMKMDLLRQFKPLIIKSSPFEKMPVVNKPSRFRPNPPHVVATWIKPELACEVSFAEMTKDGVMRHPSFEGLRDDKNAKTVIMEKTIPAEKAIKKSNKIKGKNIITPVGQNEKKSLLNNKEETQVKRINGHELKFTNLSKLYWPKEKISKRDMLNYYFEVAPYILPYLKNRPQSMNRHPNGITGKSFYFKDITGKAPSWLNTFLYHSEADNRDRNYLVAKNEASLLY
ncbi:MAG TPA: non-homologous end-joining DNA ligase, partial [Puia sp.]